MKRRNFLTATGMTGLTLSSGLAVTGKVFGLDAPWKLHPELTSDMVTQLDMFAHSLRKGYKEHKRQLSTVANVVTPKSILYNKKTSKGYKVAFENYNGNYIVLTKKSNEYRTAVYNKREQII